MSTVGALAFVVLALAVHGGTGAVVHDSDRLALAIDFLGEPLGSALVLVVLVAACLLARDRRLAVLAVLGPGLTVLVTTLTKPLVGRTINGDNLSFPSGHTAYATAIGLVAALLLASRIGAFLALTVTVPAICAAAMAWAQTTLGAHYVTDTIGGYATALCVVPAVALFLFRVSVRQSTENCRSRS